jgi:hypothetical protein
MPGDGATPGVPAGINITPGNIITTSSGTLIAFT